MGDFIGAAGAAFTVGSLNWMFNSDLNNTFSKIEDLRKTYPYLFHPKGGPTAKEFRKQSLRFAGFLLTDDVAFNGNYPAPHFRDWLRWLTWLGQEKGGTVTLDGKKYSKGNASDMILEVMATALAPGGPPQPIHFSFNPDNTVANFTVSGTTTGGFRIDVTAPDSGNVGGNSDDEDNV